MVANVPKDYPFAPRTRHVSLAHCEAAVVYRNYRFDIFVLCPVVEGACIGSCLKYPGELTCQGEKLLRRNVDAKLDCEVSACVEHMLVPTDVYDAA